jgi:hypothetical protein
VPQTNSQPRTLRIKSRSKLILQRKNKKIKKKMEAGNWKDEE